MRIGQAQDLPLQGWRHRASVGATLVVVRSRLPVSRIQRKGTYYATPEGNQAASSTCSHEEPAGEGNSAFASAPAAESEQHDEQVAIVNNAVAVHIRRQVRAARAEVEEHL